SPFLYWELHASKPDLILADVDEYVVSESVSSVPAVATNEAKTSKSKPKSVSETLIKDWISDSEDENQTKSNRFVSFGSKRFHLKQFGLLVHFRESLSVKQEEHNRQAKHLKKNSQSPRGFIDSGCSRHKTRNISNLSEYEKLMVDMLPLEETPKEVKSLVKVKSLQLLDESQVLLRVLKKNNMYSVDLKNVAPSGGLTCLFTKATSDESNLWHRRLGHINFKTMNKLKGKQHRASCKTKTVFFLATKDETSGILKAFIIGIENLIDHKVKINRCDNETEFKNKEMNLFYEKQDHLGNFDGKDDEGFFVGYSVNSKAFRVFNSRTKIVKETFYTTFLKNKPNVVGSGPTWLFDIDTLTKSMNYKPVVAGNQSIAMDMCYGSKIKCWIMDTIS
nr:hypothetical protein [Tanacetum cinerariifolium]